MQTHARTISTNPRRVNLGKIVEMLDDPSQADASLERVNANDIEIPNYQRDIRPAKLRRLIREWNPSLAGWIIVSRRANGALFVIDGQHRIEAVRHLQGKVGPYLDAIVVTDWSSTDEARFFAETQSPENRAALMPQDIHHAAVLAGDPDALTIQRVVSECGFRIGKRGADDPETGQLKPVREVNRIYERYGDRVLAQTLMLIRRAWGVHSHPESSVVAGVALFIAMYPQADLPPLAKRAAMMPIDEWVRAAKAHARAEGMTATEGVAYKLRTDYNHKRQAAGRLPDFGDTLKQHRSANRSQSSKETFARIGHTGIVKQRMAAK